MRAVGAPPERVFEFLSDLRNHWRLESSFAVLGGLEGDEGHGPTGGRIRLNGPLGIAREVRTRVLEAEPPDTGAPGRLAGRADIGRRTVGLVAWEIAARAGGGSDVRLSARVERASIVDRAALALGGRRWLERVFDRSLAGLADVFSQPR